MLVCSGIRYMYNNNNNNNNNNNGTTAWPIGNVVTSFPVKFFSIWWSCLMENHGMYGLGVHIVCPCSEIPSQWQVCQLCSSSYMRVVHIKYLCFRAFAFKSLVTVEIKENNTNNARYTVLASPTLIYGLQYWTI